MELLQTLGINWQLLLAQVVNFTVLMGALLFLVYKPVLRLLDSRRETIKKAMDDAAHVEKQRKNIEEMMVAERRKAEQETAKVLEGAKVQGEKMKREIIDAATREAEQILEKSKKQLGEERTKLVSEMQQSLASVAVKLASQILEREFKPDDQQRILQSVEKNIPALLK
jgi:F-type H+-transporting ATPase subunit b